MIERPMYVRLDTIEGGPRRGAEEPTVDEPMVEEPAARDDESWVSPYLRRRLRSLDEVLAERRAFEERCAQKDDRKPRGRVIRLSGAKKHYGRVA